VKRLIVALALSACTESEQVAAPTPPVPQAPAEAGGSLSDGASKIVAALRVRPDIDSICGGGDTFRGAMRQAVIKLVMSGELDNPRQDAESAATYLHAHCGQPESAPAIAARPGASSSSP
jgi:hypothetical protein